MAAVPHRRLSSQPQARSSDLSDNKARTNNGARFLAGATTEVRTDSYWQPQRRFAEAVGVNVFALYSYGSKVGHGHSLVLIDFLQYLRRR
jgi:hypothetical protein